MSTAITPSEVLWEESTWGHTRDHLIYQLSEKMLQQALLHRRPGQSRDQGPEGLIFYKGQFLKNNIPILHCHIGTPLAAFSMVPGMNTCAGRRNRDYVVWGPPTEWASHFPCHFTQLKFRCYTSNIQRLKKITINHMLFSFEWEKNKWNKQECPSPS